MSPGVRRELGKEPGRLCWIFLKKAAESRRIASHSELQLAEGSQGASREAKEVNAKSFPLSDLKCQKTIGKKSFGPSNKKGE